MSHALKRAAVQPGWAIKKAYLWGGSALNLRKSDVILAFFPKTGSTWVRIFLYHILNKNSLTHEFSFDQIDSVMPEFANPNLFARWSFKQSPRLIKTHHRYNPLFWQNRCVLFAREPHDTMVSFLHYANAKKEFGFSGNLEDLVTHPGMGLDSYFRFYKSWLPHAGLVVRYEDLRGNPEREFRKLVNFIGIDVEDEDITNALARASLVRTRKAQVRSSVNFKQKFAKDFVFARKGVSGEGFKQFDQELEATYQTLRAKYEFELYS